MSIWNMGMPRFPELRGDTKTDVLIVGGGITGILCAWELAQAGIDYLLIEAGRITGGTTDDTTAKITAQHGYLYHDLLRRFGADTAKAYWQVNTAAIDGYRALAERIPCDLQTTDSYLYATGSVEKLERELSAMERLGIPVSSVRELPLPFPTSGAIRMPDQAQFHPLKLLSQLSRDLNIREQTPALSFKGNTVSTGKGKIQAEKIIIATHFPIINKHGSYFLKMYQHRSYVLALENGQALDGMYRDIENSGLSFRSYGDLLLLGGGGHRTGTPGGGWAELEATAKRYYPNAQIRSRWATQDCMTLDGMPYIGHYSKNTPHLLVATGYNEWGMTSAMVAAKMLTELVRGKEIDPIFSPSRTVLRPQLLYNMIGSAKNLLTPTRPRCPHMGCALKWNPQERSWDCPCHGSRFTKDGELLDGPANGDK